MQDWGSVASTSQQLQDMGLTRAEAENLVNFQRPEREYSIRELPNGERVTVVDTRQDVFDHAKPSEYPRIARKEILEHFQGQTLPLGENDLARVTRNTAGEYTHPATRLERQEYNSKMKASAELNNLLETAEYVGSANDNKNHSEALLGFDYYKTKFVVDGKTFEGIINIATSENGRVLYDINNIREVSDYGKPATRMAQSTSVLTAGDLSENSVASDPQNVNAESRAAIEKLSSDMGITTVFDDTLPQSVNGYYDTQTGEIHINPKADVNTVFSHELAHSLENTSAYQKLKDLVLNELGDEAETLRQQKSRLVRWIKNGHLFRYTQYQNRCPTVVRETGLEPVRRRHTHLKRACLPVPALAHNQR